jgi:Icc protein
MRMPEHPAPDRVLLHLSDTHLRAGGSRIWDVVDGARNLARALAVIEESGVRPDAVVFTGDLVDRGERAAYAQLRSLVEPFAARLDAPVLWVMGNHDDRAALRAELLDDDSADMRPVDRVDEIDGLRIITLDTSVPGAHHGELSRDQLGWLTDVLRTPAPLGTILAMHHPPVPSVLALAASVELRGQRELAEVLAGTDVRAILAGHLHYSTFATVAGIPVSVASSTCYAQDLTVPVGGTRPQDGAQAFNLVHVYDDTVVHSVVPVEAPRVMEYTDPARAQALLADAGVGGVRVTRRQASPTRPLPVLH